MDSIQLSNFYRLLPHWPRNGMEISNLLENFSKLVSAPLVAFYLSDLDPINPTASSTRSQEIAQRLGFRVSESWLRASNQAEIPHLLEDFIKKQVLQKESKSVQTPYAVLKKVQGSGDFLNGLQIGIVPIVTQAEGQSLVYGWLIAGFGKPMSVEEELLMLSAGERLISLAETAHLESEIQIRSQFLSIASHELKTPLTSIYGMLQLQERMYRLKKDDPALKDPVRQQAYMKRMIRQVERLNELIDGLLDISRIQNGRFMVEPTETDVALLLRETVGSRLENVAQESGVKLNVETPQSLLVWVDPVRMEEVVSNLVMNAIRFSPEGGVVWVRLRPDGESFRLSVRDQGPSVPIEDRERIFQPFERAQRTARLGGLGLGLFISRQIAQLHGGNVGLIESVPGKGNVFEANFPMRGATAASA
jgi:signal transduction histidine kinase